MYDLFQYKSLLGFMESNDDYKAVSGSGALGKYQFMPTTLNALRDLFGLIDWGNTEVFLNSSFLQEMYIDAQIKDSYNFLTNNNLTRFIGSNVTGSKRFPSLTVSLSVYGLLAGVHLAGAGNVVEYFESGYDPDDGNTSLTDYMAFFSKNLRSANDLFYYAAFAFIVLSVLYLK